MKSAIHNVRHGLHRMRDGPVSVATVWLALVVLLVAFSMAAARAQSAAPESAPYLAGGVGADEIERLSARQGEFNVKLVFTLVEGNYVSDVAVVVTDKAGKSVLAVTSPGPLLLAKLPRGSYVVSSTYDGQTLTRRIDVRDRLRTEYIRWPSNPETDFPGPKATERE